MILIDLVFVFQMLQFNQAVKSKDPSVRLTKLKYIFR